MREMVFFLLGFSMVAAHSSNCDRRGCSARNGAAALSVHGSLGKRNDNLSPRLWAGEVQGLINIIKWRDTCKGLLEGRKPPIEDHPFLVFEANDGKIGLLPVKLAGMVAEFYSNAPGIVQDFRTIHKDEFPDGISKIEFRQTLVKNLKAMTPVAEALVSELREEAGKTWKYVATRLINGYGAIGRSGRESS